MSYTAVSFAQDEQPSAAKWNLLYENDRALSSKPSEIDITNDTWIAWKKADGTDQNVIKYGDDDYIKFGIMPYVDYTDNANVETGELLWQFGWGFVVGDGTDTFEETVTFDVAYDTLLFVQTCFNGRIDNVDPTDVTDTDNNSGDNLIGHADSQTATDFVMSITDVDDATHASSQRFVYSWWAVGLKA